MQSSVTTLRKVFPHTWGCDTEKPLTIECQGLHFLALLPVPVFDGPLYLLLENLFG